MIYLRCFSLPSEAQEFDFNLRGFAYAGNGQKVQSFEVLRQCYSSRYPFGVLSRKSLDRICFGNITLLCGSNGSGKSTLLNIIANKLRIRRSTPYNRSAFYEDYLAFCDAEIACGDDDYQIDIENTGKIITSDDVFDYMLQLRVKNEEIDLKRRLMLNKKAEYAFHKPTEIDFENPISIREFRRYVEMSRKTGSKYVRDHLGFNIQEFSNGESGYQYFVDAIQPNGLYLLDEPENSLAANLQIELAHFISEMARHFRCQFIISSHSPFLLSMKGAQVYDMDATPVTLRDWATLSNVQLYHRFFKEHDAEFG